MQCFNCLWVDVCLGIIFLLHILPFFLRKKLVETVSLYGNLFCHGVLFLLMLVLQFPLEELLALVLLSALLGLGMAYLAERGRKA